jgi:hypothetical protein
MGKLTYKALGLVLGALSGAAAGALFTQAWRLVDHGREAPAATDEERGWGEILPAAALHGAVFAVVKAVVDRSSAEGVRHVTGTWPA